MDSAIFIHTRLIFLIQNQPTKETTTCANFVKVIVDFMTARSRSIWWTPSEHHGQNLCQASFPDLFKPIDGVPVSSLRSHIRYPRALLKIQARMFTTFHRPILWCSTTRKTSGRSRPTGRKTMDPYYQIMKLPGGKARGFHSSPAFYTIETGQSCRVGWR